MSGWDEVDCEAFSEDVAAKLDRIIELMEQVVSISAMTNEQKQGLPQLYASTIHSAKRAKQQGIA